MTEVMQGNENRRTPAHDANGYTQPVIFRAGPQSTSQG